MYIKWKCRLISEYIVRLLLRSKFTDISPLLIFMLYSGVEFGMAEGVLGGHREKNVMHVYIFILLCSLYKKNMYISHDIFLIIMYHYIRMSFILILSVCNWFLRIKYILSFVRFLLVIHLRKSSLYIY